MKLEDLKDSYEKFKHLTVDTTYEECRIRKLYSYNTIRRREALSYTGFNRDRLIMINPLFILKFKRDEITQNMLFLLLIGSNDYSVQCVLRKLAPLVEEETFKAALYFLFDGVNKLLIPNRDDRHCMDILFLLDYYVFPQFKNLITSIFNSGKSRREETPDDWKKIIDNPEIIYDILGPSLELVELAHMASRKKYGTTRLLDKFIDYHTNSTVSPVRYYDADNVDTLIMLAEDPFSEEVQLRVIDEMTKFNSNNKIMLCHHHLSLRQLCKLFSDITPTVACRIVSELGASMDNLVNYDYDWDNCPSEVKLLIEMEQQGGDLDGDCCAAG